MKILKQKMSKEGILQELKRRRFYEKPSVKKKRKTREARKRLRRELKRKTGMGTGGPGGPNRM
jgi:small subunit ribosomal protein S21